MHIVLMFAPPIELTRVTGDVVVAFVMRGSLCNQRAALNLAKSTGKIR
jgi:hypothetical protein